MSTAAARPTFSDGVLQWRLLPPIVVGVGYYFGCLAGFAARFPSSGISFFWPPTALLTAALLVTAQRTWPGLLAAGFAAHAIAHAQNGVPLATWPIQFLGNATQAALAAFIVRRYSTGVSLFSDLRHVLTFIIGACVLAPAVASLIPAIAYVHLGWAPDVAHAWVARTVSNTAASLTLVPSIVIAWRYLWPKPPGIPRRLGEFGILLVGIFAAHTAAGYIERTDVLGLLAVLYAPIPFLVWATIRFGGAGVSIALLWTTFLTISTAMTGRGPLAIGASGDTVIAIQMFLVMTAVPMMLIAGLLEQNRARHLALVEAERQMSAILGAHPDLMFLQTRDGVYLHYYAKNAADLLVDPQAFLGRKMRDVLPLGLADAFTHAFETATLDEAVVIDYPLPMHGILRHYEDSPIGRAVRCQIQIGTEVNAGLIAIYKEGAAFEVIAIDLDGMPRADWAEAVLTRPIAVRPIGRPAADAAEKNSGWRDMVRRLGAMLDPTRRLHAVAAIEVRPLSPI